MTHKSYVWTVVTSGLLFITSTVPALATGTFFVDSTSGNDANNCTSADTACLTLAGAKALIIALPDPSNTTLKLSGTFTDQVSFAATDVTQPDTLDGLHITATDKSNQPTIDTSVAGTAAVQVSDIDQLTIDHLIILGGMDGIVVTGNSSTYVADTAVHHNAISGIADETSASAIELQYLKGATIHDNTIHDVAVTLTDASYTTLYGIYLYYGMDVEIQDNIISTFGINNTLTAAGSHTGYIYGMYLYNVSEGTVDHNTLTDITSTETGLVTATNHTGQVYGLYAINLLDMAVDDNTFTTITSTTAADVDSNYGSSTAYAIFVSDLRADDGVATIQNNTVNTVTGTQATKTGAPVAYGIAVQFGYGAVVSDNTVKNITTVHTSSIAGAAVSGSVVGIFGPYFGGSTTVSRNVVDGVNATVNYSGATASSVTVRGIYLYGGTGAVTGNTVTNLSWSVDNNDTASFYDYVTLYGIDASYSNGIIIKKNQLHDFSYSYANAGTDGTAVLTTYGLAVTGSDSPLIQNNTITDVTPTAAITDATDAAYLSMNTYGLFLNKTNNAVVHKNKVKRFTVTAGAGNSNTVFNYGYGVYLNYVSGTFSNSRIVHYDMTSTVVDGGINQLFYGVTLTTESALTALTGTMIRDITTTTTGADSSQQNVGFFIGHAPSLVVEGNQLRPFTTSADPASGLTMHGISFVSDASQARVLDNILLGNSDFTGGAFVGVNLPSDSTVDIDLIHNTIANWEYPVSVDGGYKVYLRNNILAAVGADGYALAVGRDNVNNDSFKSDYNLLYNATVADQLIYDTDNTIAIALGDWINVGGSYGYDLHSINKAPKIKDTGRLKSGSKAINAGSQDYPYAADDSELVYLGTDINGDQRPLDHKTKQVDIGADEYHK